MTGQTEYERAREHAIDARQDAINALTEALFASGHCNARVAAEGIVDAIMLAVLTRIAAREARP